MENITINDLVAGCLPTLSWAMPYKRLFKRFYQLQYKEEDFS